MADSDAPPKGILRQPSGKKKRGSVVWDEPTLAEHDKDRGTRMKINEPDTPFEPTTRAIPLEDQVAAGMAAGGAPGGTAAAQYDAIDAMSSAAAAKADADEEAEEWVDSDEEGAAAAPAKPATSSADAAEHARFEAARKAHYAQEVARMKQLKAQALLDDEDDDDDEGGDDTSASAGAGAASAAH